MSIEIFDSLGPMGQIATIAGYAEFRKFVEANHLGGELQKLLDSGNSSSPKVLASQIKDVLYGYDVPPEVKNILISIQKLAEVAKDVVILK